MPITDRAERRAIHLSIWGNLIAALLGLFFAFLTNSEAVLIDGVYSLIFFAVSLLSLKVAALVQRPDNELYPFGYVTYEPILNLSKGLLILLVDVFAVTTAVMALCGDGRRVNAPMTCGYAMLVTVLCVVGALYLRRQSKRTKSQIVAVDAKNWWIDAVISAGVALAFSIAVLVEMTPYAFIAPYVDPVVVIVLVLAMLPVPWMIIRDNWRQIVSRSVDPSCLAEIEERLEAVRAETPWRDQCLRVVREGRLLYVHLYILGGPSLLEDADQCREKIFRALKDIQAELALDVSFTADPKWMRRASGDE